MKKFILILLFFCQIAHADLPLSLEELVTDKGKFKLDSNLSYINREISQKEFAAPLYIQTTNNNLVAVPTILNDTDSNSDVIVGTVGLRYGLTGKTDVYASASHLWRSEREFNGSGSLKNRDRQFSDVSLGVSHILCKTAKIPR